MDTSRFTTKAEREALLTAAQRAQEAFFDAARALEKAYSDDADINSEDIEFYDIDKLDAEMADEETEDRVLYNALGERVLWRGVGE
jgi:hypothetical protein